MTLLLRGLLGAVIDYMFVGFGLIAGMLWLSKHLPIPTQISVATLPLLFAIHVVSLWRWGSTLGGRIFGTCVRTEDGTPLRVRHALVRVAVIWGETLLLTICSLFMVIGLAVFAKRKRALPHDLTSKTMLAWRRD